MLFICRLCQSLSGRGRQQEDSNYFLSESSRSQPYSLSQPSAGVRVRERITVTPHNQRTPATSSGAGPIPRRIDAQAARMERADAALAQALAELWHQQEGASASQIRALEEQEQQLMARWTQDARQPSPQGHIDPAWFDELAESQPLGFGVCPVCMDEKETYSLGTCGHGLCLRCAVSYVRTALGDAAQDIKAGGVRCPLHYTKCEVLVTSDRVRGLFQVARQREPRTVSFQPLQEKEVDKFENFALEATIPFDQKSFCPKCNRLCILDEGTQVEVRCPYADCGHSWDRSAHSGQDKATKAFIEATSKGCPNCHQRITHYHGHDCHHISPSTNGCPNCHQHFCYQCLRKHGKPGHRDWNSACEHRQSFCNTSDIKQFLKMTPYPHDSRCGCVICPDCRPGKACPQCPGSCVVCRGVLPPGTR